MYEFYDDIKKGKLSTTKCKDCGNVTWPPKVICPKCFSKNYELIEIKEGEIYSYTHLLGGCTPHHECPMIIALIKTELGIKIVSEIVDTSIDEINIGTGVKPTNVQVGKNRFIYAFKVK